jgi:fatty acid desaturase
MQLHPISFYARSLKTSLPHGVHRPAHSRLLWLPVHFGLVILGLVALSNGWVPTYLAWLVSIPIGFSFGCLAFLAHETLHGGVVHNRRLQQLVGWLGFLPFTVSPRLWVAWHNRVHHGSSNQPGLDPDAYPTLEEYEKSPALRVVTDHLGPGRHGLGTPLAVLIGFSVHSMNTLFKARKSKILDARQHRWAVADTMLGVAIWVGVFLVVGWLPFLFGFVVPLALGNALVMAHILTNHTLSPHTEVNDPLVNTLSVTVPGWLEWSTLQFGYHVEHHLFPWMSARHARAVRTQIIARWPERYQSMPLSRALWSLHRTARVYKNPTTLIDVRGGKEWSTLLPSTVNTATGGS